MTSNVAQLTTSIVLQVVKVAFVVSKRTRVTGHHGRIIYLRIFSNILDSFCMKEELMESNMNSFIRRVFDAVNK